MGLFKFIKEAGEKLGIIDDKDDDKTSDVIRSHVEKLGLNIENLMVKKQGEKLVLSGKAPSQEAMEKAVLAAGNVHGIGEVEARLDSAEAAQGAQRQREPKFYTVKSGDTLSKIAKEVYGDANRYQEIFNANRPMLNDPNKIYPGQSLRIPQEEPALA